VTDGTARIWDATTGACLHVLEGHTNSVARPAFGPDGSLVTADKRESGSQVFVWDTDTGDRRSATRIPALEAVAISPVHFLFACLPAEIAPDRVIIVSLPHPGLEDA
jgi:WD40 repeat protein